MLQKTILASLSMLALATMSHAQTAIRAWELNGDFSDVLGHAALTGNGGSVGASNYTFAAGQGLLFPSDTTVTGNYSLETYFQFTNTNGFRRIADWLGGTSDNGLYVLNGTATYYQGGSNSSGVVFANNDLAHLVVTRTAADNLSVYVNGALVLAFTPAQTTALNGTDFHLFQDDAAVGGENSAGSAEYVRIYNSVLTGGEVTTLFNNRNNPFVAGASAPEPTTLVLLGLGIVPLAGAIRRRKRA